MKPFFLVFCGCLFFAGLPAQDMGNLIKEADRLEHLPNERAALNKFKEIIKLQPSNCYALNKCSELCSRIGNRQPEAKQKQAYYEAAKNYALLSLKVNPNNAEANTVMAIALGRVSLSKGGKEKLETANEIKKYADIALKNDPSNYKAWHVLGRWHYELSTLNFIERAAAKLLFGALPNSSMAAAIAAFEKCNSLNGNFMSNYFELARAYDKAGNKPKALAAFQKVMGLPNTTEDDAGIKQDAKRLSEHLN